MTKMNSNEKKRRTKEGNKKDEGKLGKVDEQ